MKRVTHTTVYVDKQEVLYTISEQQVLRTPYFGTGLPFSRSYAQKKGIYAQHVSLGITQPAIKFLKYQNSKIRKKLKSIKITIL